VCRDTLYCCVLSPQILFKTFQKKLPSEILFFASLPLSFV
jgi:hypothetical protein